MDNRFEKRRSYGKVAKVGLVWGFVREGANSLVALPAAMILARLLSPAEMGVAAAAAFFVQLSSRLTSFGFGVALVRARYISRDHVSSVFLVKLVIGLLGWALVTLIAPAAGAFLRSADAAALIPTAALAFLIMPFGTVATALLTRDMRYRDSSTSDWLAALSQYGTAIFLAAHGFSYWSLVYGALTGEAVRALCRAWMARWWPRVAYSRDAMRDLFSFGAGIYVKDLLDFSAQNLDNLIVGRVLGITALGFYDKAFVTMKRLTAKLNLAGPGVSFRIFALIHDEPERFRRAYRKVILSITVLGYPAITGMIVTAPELIEILFGDQWLPAVLPFQILCAGALLQLLNTYASTALQAKGHIWSQVTRQVVATIVLVASVWIFSRWGIAGAAAGVVAATLVMTVMLTGILRRLAALSWRDLLSPQVPALVCAGGLLLVLVATRMLVRSITEQPAAETLLAVCVTIGAVYYLSFLLFSRFRDVRAVLQETLEDLAPSLARRLPWAQASRKLQTASPL